MVFYKQVLEDELLSKEKNMSDKKQSNDRYTNADFEVQSPGVGFDNQEDSKNPSKTSK